MDLRDRTVMILGGSGLVGHAVARRLLGAAPRRVVLVALFEEEVRATARALEPHRGGRRSRSSGAMSSSPRASPVWSAGRSWRTRSTAG